MKRAAALVLCLGDSFILRKYFRDLDDGLVRSLPITVSQLQLLISIAVLVS